MTLRPNRYHKNRVGLLPARKGEFHAMRNHAPKKRNMGRLRPEGGWRDDPAFLFGLRSGLALADLGAPPPFDWRAAFVLVTGFLVALWCFNHLA